MVNKNVLRPRIEKIHQYLSRIKPTRKIVYKAFAGNQDLQDIVEYNLFQIINHLIDMCHHVVVDEGYGFPESAHEAADLLVQRKVLAPKYGDKLKKMIGFRNVIGHDYLDIDKKIVYEIWTKRLKDIEKIVHEMANRYL